MSQSQWLSMSSGHLGRARMCQQGMCSALVLGVMQYLHTRTGGYRARTGFITCWD